MKIKKSLAVLNFTSLEQAYVPTLISLTFVILANGACPSDNSKSKTC